MKKLFTLFALLVCFLGAKAIEITDFAVDYTQVGKSTVGWKADIITDDLITADAEGLHLNNPEVRPNFYDYQLWIFNNAALEVEQTYTIKFVAKVSEGSATVRYRIGDWGGGIAGDLVVNSTEYQEYEVSGAATVANCGLLIQFGDYVGTVSFKSVTITHEGKEERPVQWQNILVNGDAEGEFGEVPCFQSKEFGMNPGEDGQPSIHAGEIIEENGNKIFVCHSKEVSPVIVFEEDTELWGTQYKAGDPKPDNAWQNQVWFVLPRAAKDGEQFKLSFKYKASKACKVSTQDHKEPGAYLGGGSYGDINFTTEWQEYSKEFSAAGTMQSIALNLGQEIYTEDVDFFFDDIEVSEMVLDHGWFVTAKNTNSGMVDYDFDTATEFTYDEGEEAYVATVGKAGDQDSWVDEIMISTVRGNSKAFKSATIKATISAVDTWTNYETGSNAKIKLPAAGVWNIYVDDVLNQIMAEQVEGDVVKDPLNPEDCINATEVVVNAGERNMNIDEAKAAGLLADPENPTDEEKAQYNGQPWDNQFFLIGNRALEAGEEVYVKFEYKADAAATVGSQNTTGPGSYLFWKGLGDLNFTTEWQTYEGTIAIPADTNGNQDSWTFNLSNMREANKYYFKNFIFMTADYTENLIATEGTENFWVKERGVNNNTAYEFGTDPENPETGINSVVNGNAASAKVFNLAGQGVSKEFKGIVVKNGKKFIAE